MEINYKDLQTLFLNETQLAIDYIKLIISTTSGFNIFQEFFDFHKKNSHVSTCQNSWSENQLVIHCENCCLVSNSILCLPCFLNGNHQGHDYSICLSFTGNCDCGDLSLCKRSGFCSKHAGLDHNSHPENYLDEKLRTLLTDIVFKAIFESIQKILPYDISTLSQILQFLRIFIQFGDGFRRLISISLTEKIDFEKFINRIFDVSYEFNVELESFFGLLTNDELFKSNFAKYNYKLMATKIIPIELSVSKGNNIELCKSISPWNNFWYHSYSEGVMRDISKSENFNWNDFIIQILTYTKEILTFKGLNFYFKDVPNFLIHIGLLSNFAQNEPDDKKQELFDRIVTEILANVTNVTTTFNVDIQDQYSFSYLFIFHSLFYHILKAFKSSENLKIDKLFELFDQSFDISSIFYIFKNAVENGITNDNDRLVHNFIKSSNVNGTVLNDNDYKSFPKGASFFISNPLFYSLAYLLRIDETCRIKIAELLSLEKYQSLRIQIGIATLKNLLAMVCLTQSLVPKTENLPIVSFLSELSDNPSRASDGISLLIPLLQLIIGIQCKENNCANEFSFKEFFAFEMAREIGIFDDSKDDFNVGNKKQMIFSFLYLSLLFVTERILFNFDGYKFDKEQIIFGLKQGVSDLNELNNLFDSRVNEKESKFYILNKIIHEVATVRQNTKKGSMNENIDQEVSFDLKDEIEVNFVSAINSFNCEKVLMNNEISKHPDKLLKLLPFEPEETYFFNNNSNVNVRLKEFFVTPTILAIIYRTLRKSSEAHSNELNDHLAMNILILLSKFVQDSNFRSSDNIKSTIKPNKIIKYKLSIVDLINQLKRSVFNYGMNQNRNYSITNIMTKESFDLFLKMKICSSTESPKSIVDVLLEKGQLGKNVLTQIGVEVEGEKDEDKNKKDQNQVKKDRARKLKENIINHFKSFSSSFSLEADQNDDENTEKELCSICSIDKEDEILSYPLYIYRTKFPFIVDKPPFVQMTQLAAMKEADVFQDEDILEKIDENEVDENDEKDQVPTVDAMLAQVLNMSPGLDITDGMNEEQSQLLRNTNDCIHQLVLVEHENLVQRAAERKNRRKEEKMLKFQKQKEELIRKQKSLNNPNSMVYKQCTAGNIFVIQFGICQHLVHPNCVKKDDFTCPIDRSFKNGFLPNIDDLTDDVIYADGNNKNFENLSEKLKESLNVFISKYSLFFKASEDKIVDVFVELVKSLSGLIVTFEVRLRSLPDCLDKRKTKVLARNLFLTTWYAYRMKGKPTMKTGFTDDISEDVDSKLTVFQRFIKKLIEADEIEEDVSTKNEILKNLVSSFVESSFNQCRNYKEEKEKCLFLRRVCLADHFLLKKKDTENIEIKSQDIIDWDEILSSENLSQKFNAPFKYLNDGSEFEFKPFIFAKLPKEFLRFSQEPYNFPVELVGQITIFNLLDYNSMIETYDDLDEGDGNDAGVDYMNGLRILNADDMISDLHTLFSKKKYPSVFLFIGKDASKICVIDGRRICSMRPFYLDMYGCTDIGYKRSQPLFLNDERYEKVIDQVLSGDFSSNLNQF